MGLLEVSVGMFVSLAFDKRSYFDDLTMEVCHTKRLELRWWIYLVPMVDMWLWASDSGVRQWLGSYWLVVYQFLVAIEAVYGKYDICLYALGQLGLPCLEYPVPFPFLSADYLGRL
ncbi:hypothetical protein L3X38_012681 [Prunus dulcis]|uniref:Uncharacterized protein n=1 Tax=Prunus dulcis TaxID=3755 RepID=A0AAD4WK31_PRUDU|nr:hypothetical protein L3X38_012681 [Prunus dulcis]